jgi:outer membrane protein assembly factor BamB
MLNQAASDEVMWCIRRTVFHSGGHAIRCARPISRARSSAEVTVAICLVMSCFLCARNARLNAGDWPQWGGRNERNFVGDETGLAASFLRGGPETGEGRKLGSFGESLKWVAHLGTQTYVTPAVAQGKVLMGSNDLRVDDSRWEKTGGGLLVCLDESTGALIWQLVMPRLKTANPDFNYDDLELGLCSSPTIDGNRVYVVSNRGEVLCLDLNGQADGNAGPYIDEGRYMRDARVWPDKPGRCDARNVPPQAEPAEVHATDGDIIWKYDFISELDVWPQDAVDCSILVLDDYLYVCTSNGVDRSHKKIPSPNAPDLIVLDKHSGKLLAVMDPPLGNAIFHGDWSSPTLARIGQRTLIVWGGGDGVCYAFDAQFTPGTDGKPGRLNKVWSFDCNPPVNKLRDGKPLPYNQNSEGPSEIIATPVIHDQRVYVTVGQDSRHGMGPGCFSCIDATREGDITETGKVWQSLDVQRSFSSAAVADGLVFIADFTGVLRCLDVATGATYWTHDLKKRVFASPLVADGKVFIGTEAGVMLVAAAKKEKQIIGEVKVDGPIYATPVVANGVLYVASQKTLYAVKLSK